VRLYFRLTSYLLYDRGGAAKLAVIFFSYWLTCLCFNTGKPLRIFNNMCLRDRERESACVWLIYLMNLKEGGHGLMC